jgi:cysteinyl-tRNA synthetase
MIKLYDTLVRKVRQFKPIKENKVGLYSCGPTVYNFVHLGNLRAYLFVDLLKRYLKYRGFEVNHIMNITDVDDKTIRDSQKEDRKLNEFTQFYFNAFIEDLKSLNIVLPETISLATEHIGDMVSLIMKLEKKGFTYKANGSIYFNIKKFKNYGKLALLDKQELKRNADNRLSVKDEYEKEEISDFVLWKNWKSEDGENYWETEIGKGRPGWHIECSAMSMKYLGESFDIHTGGVDLIFPHHTNEIAQSEAATGQKFVNFWMHNEHLMVEGQKMAKSLNNFYTLRDEKIKKYNPLIIRMTLLRAHYRQILNFSFEGIEESINIADKFINFLVGLDSIKGTENNNVSVDELINDNREKLIKFMDDDLNISMLFSTLFDFMNQINKQMADLNILQSKKIKEYIFEVDSILGVIEKLYTQYVYGLNKLLGDELVKRLLKERVIMKNSHDFTGADDIRTRLEKIGISVQDTKEGCSMKFIGFLK